MQTGKIRRIRLSDRCMRHQCCVQKAKVVNNFGFVSARLAKVGQKQPEPPEISNGGKSKRKNEKLGNWEWQHAPVGQLPWQLHASDRRGAHKLAKKATKTAKTKPKASE